MTGTAIRPSRGLDDVRVAWHNRAMRWSLVLSALVVVPFVLRYLGYHSMIDLSVYRSEGFALRHRIDIYGPINAVYDLRATYPPFAVLCFTGLTVVPLQALFVLSAAANVALLAVAIELSRRLIARRCGPIHPCAVPLLTAAAVWCEPVFTTVCYGQINLLVLVLVLWDFTRPAESRSRGIALGVAVGLKITPALFVVYLLITRRSRIAARAAAAFAATVLVSAAALPGETWRFWTRLVFDTGRVGNIANPANQSLRGVLTRAVGAFDLGALGPAVIGAVAVLGLGCSVLAYRRRGEAWGLCTAAVTGLLVSPVSWTHHWVWCVPVALLLWAATRASPPAVRVALLLAFLLAFLSYLPSIIPSDHVANLHLNAGEQLISLPYVAFGLAFLVLAVTRWERPRPSK
ncbi:MAG: glycosyltransferase 87 family protein [Jatrophihabitantaceae bacterium]